VRDGFLIKIVPPGGYDVYRLHVSRQAAAALAVGLVLVVLGALGLHAWQLQQADAAMRAQQGKIEAVDRQADALARQLRSLRLESEALQRMLGAPAPAAKRGENHAARDDRPRDIAAVQARLQRLARASAATAAEQRRLAVTVRRVVDLRRLAELARARMLAALPSINPVGGGIAAGFGWRVSPWPEFHKGLDLEADYATPVRAAADGTVVSAGWDGGFGIKIALDHGNGYQTWYAHLSRVDVAVGERVRKGETIARVGATGEATGPHLHYQIMRDGTAIDPAPFLDGVPERVLASLPDPQRVR
jgi:murein DD-endopeptidase MepM/ murein hydrolase activator NlpD